MATEIYPPVGFHFKVEFQDIGNVGDNDTKFQSVSGLSVDLETEEIAEGGENRFKHKLPVKSKYPNLVLKRGMLVNSDLIAWIKSAINDLDINPATIIVTLLNDEDEPLKTWNIVHAYPIKWNVDAFNAEESKIVAETIELAYNYFTVN